MKHLYSLLIVLFSLSASAQINYEQGYFIDNQNVKTQCLIRNIDWNSTPTEFEFKRDENAPDETKKNYQVKEFSVGESTFISQDVAVDQSSDKLNNLSVLKNPEFKTQRIFIKVLVDGTAKLYLYTTTDYQRFFYSTNGNPIEQLVYKRYYPDNVKLDVATNNYYRQQLWNNAKCDNATLSDLGKIGYNKNELVHYFESLNLCKGDKTAEKKKAASEGSFNLKASAYLGQHSFSIDAQPLFGHDFGSKSYVSFGLEGEFILPFWNNKWSTFAEVSFNSYKKTDTADEATYEANVRYLLFSAGFRHYVFLGPRSKLFFDAALTYEGISSSSGITYTNGSHHYDPYDFGSNSIVPAFGIGYNYTKFFLEFRIDGTGNATPYGGIEYKYNNMKLIARYQFL